MSIKLAATIRGVGLAAAACIGAAGLVPLAMAAPKKPKPGATTKKPSKVPGMAVPANVATKKPDAKHPYGGRANGEFSGTFAGLSIDDAGHFEVSLANHLGVRAFDGCKRRASDFPVVLDALWHAKDPVKLEVSGGCIRKITAWNFR